MYLYIPTLICTIITKQSAGARVWLTCLNNTKITVLVLTHLLKKIEAKMIDDRNATLSQMSAIYLVDTGQVTRR